MSETQIPAEYQVGCRFSTENGAKVRIISINAKAKKLICRVGCDATPRQKGWSRQISVHGFIEYSFDGKTKDRKKDGFDLVARIGESRRPIPIHVGLAPKVGFRYKARGGAIIEINNTSVMADDTVSGSRKIKFLGDFISGGPSLPQGGRLDQNTFFWKSDGSFGDNAPGSQHDLDLVENIGKIPSADNTPVLSVYDGSEIQAGEQIDGKFDYLRKTKSEELIAQDQ